MLHIHSLLHFIRHARILAGSVRFLGAMLLTLLFSLLQFVAGESEAAMPAEKESDHFIIDLFLVDSTVSICEEYDPDSDSRFRGVDRTYPLRSPNAVNTNAYTSIVHRLQPRIVMIPRMNRTPKPKSVYRCFTRAPGIGHCREV